MKKIYIFVLVLICAVIAGGASYFFFVIYKQENIQEVPRIVETSDERLPDISDISAIPFENCGIEAAPDVIKEQARAIEEEMKSMSGYANHTICEINLDNDVTTNEYIMMSAYPGQNVTFYVYKHIDTEWKIILKTSASVAYVLKEKRDGFYSLLFSGRVSAGERYWEIYKWSNQLEQYEEAQNWVENY